MSLYGSIQMAGNTLQAMQIGMHVVGNNIANANTPGFIREKAIFTPAPVQKIGNLTLGLGVQVAGIVQSVDQFLESRLRDAAGDRAGADVQDAAYRELELILNPLPGQVSIDSALSDFISAIENVVTEPENNAIRNLAVLAGDTLTTRVNTVARSVTALHKDYARQVTDLSSEINSLAEQIRKLNLQIVTVEGGDASNQAGALRSERATALKRLAEIADIKVTQTPAGATNVAIGGEFLVFEGTRREVEVAFSSSEGLSTASINFADNDSPLHVSGGQLAGIYAARDTVVGGFLDRLDGFSAALASEFNKIHTQGFGATGYSSITSLNSVSSPTTPLDEAGLDFTPVNGSFHVVLKNTTTGLSKTSTINVNLLGLDGDSTLASIAAEINALDGISATVTSDNQLRVTADSGETVVALVDDRSQPSNVLNALGINTFFTGDTAATLGVNPGLLADSSKLAAALDEIGVENENAQRMVSLYDTGLSSLGGATITGAYDQLLSETIQGATVAASLKDGFQVFEDTLAASAQAISGVNLDEEAVDLILLQRTYQASARYISTLSELLDILVAI